MVNAVSFLETFHDRGPTKGIIWMLYGIVIYIYTYKCFMCFFWCIYIYIYNYMHMWYTHTYLYIYILLCICLCFCASSFVCHRFDACFWQYVQGILERGRLQDKIRIVATGTAKILRINGLVEGFHQQETMSYHRFSHEIYVFLL